MVRLLSNVISVTKSNRPHSDWFCWESL